MNLVIWAVVAYGMTTIMVYGSIFNGLRRWIHRNGEPNGGFAITQPLFSFVSSLIKCMLCTGTWVGFFLSLVFFSPSMEINGLNRLLSVFFDGMLGAGFVWAINAIIEWFEENRPSNK
jgi:uncharacterized membrane protein required for colicin V production